MRPFRSCHICTSIRWWHCVYHTVTRITSFRCISHLLPLTEVQKNRFYVPYILMSFPVARLPGRCLKDIFFIIAGDIYVSGIGVQNHLLSERREPDRFASLQTLSFLIFFARRFKNRRLFNLPIGTGLSGLSSDRSTKE